MQDPVEVVALLQEGTALVVVARIELALHRPAEAFQCGGGDDPFGRPADPQQQIDLGARRGRDDRAGDVAVGDQEDAGARLSDLGDQPVVARPSEHGDRDLLRALPLAFATWRMFSATGALMSITSAASGPVAILSM